MPELVAVSSAPRQSPCHPRLEGGDKAQSKMATEETISTIAKALGEVDEIPVSQITGIV